jgi:hypothetical protein
MLMGAIPSGGYVLTTTEGSNAVPQTVTIQNLRDIANILRIPPLDDSVRSIYIFRSKVKPPGGGGR